MWNIHAISEHPNFDGRRIVVKKLITLWRTIKRNISKILASQWDSTERSKKLISQYKERVLLALEEVNKIRQSERLKHANDDTWAQILQDALKGVHAWKRIYTQQEQTEIEELLSMDTNDTTHTGVLFAQAFMRIIARILPQHQNIPFIKN